MPTCESLRFHVMGSLISSVLVNGPALTNLCPPLRSTSTSPHSIFPSHKSSSSCLLLSSLHWPLTKCVFVSLTEAQCVCARWPEAAHDQWSTAKNVKAGDSFPHRIPSLVSTPHFDYVIFPPFYFHCLFLLMSSLYLKPKPVLISIGASLSQPTLVDLWFLKC